MLNIGGNLRDCKFRLFKWLGQPKKKKSTHDIDVYRNGCCIPYPPLATIFAEKVGVGALSSYTFQRLQP